MTEDFGLDWYVPRLDPNILLLNELLLFVGACRQTVTAKESSILSEIKILSKVR